MYKIKTLPNGLRLVTAPIGGTETVTVLAMAATGSKNENKQNNGISHFLEHMFFKGTKNRPTAIKISGELDSLGGVYNAFTTKEYTGFWSKVDAKSAEKAMDVISDMLLNSKFVSAEIEREKGVIIEELNMYLDNPMYHIEDLFENLLYGDQPAGWDIIGTKETITSFTRKDFVDYVRKQYGSQNLVVCLAGNITPQMEKMVIKYFSVGKSSKMTLRAKTTESQKVPALNCFYKKTDQAHLSLGVRGYASGDKREMAAKLLSIILGGSMSSRLFVNLRERNGLAYYVRTNAEFYHDAGYVSTQAGVQVDNFLRSLQIIMAEYKKMKTILVGKEELQRAKDMLRGRLVIQMESSDNVANWYTRQAVMDEPIISPQEYIKSIEKVTAVDIRQVAQDIFVNEKLNLAVIGPYKDQKEILRALTF